MSDASASANAVWRLSIVIHAYSTSRTRPASASVAARCVRSRTVERRTVYRAERSLAMSPVACCVIAFPMWHAPSGSVDSSAKTDAMTPGETSTTGTSAVRTKGRCRRVAGYRRLNRRLPTGYGGIGKRREAVAQCTARGDGPFWWKPRQIVHPLHHACTCSVVQAGYQSVDFLP